MDTFIQIRSSKFPILPGEKEELVNEEMSDKAVAQDLQPKLQDRGYEAPFFCCEDWGWWVEMWKCKTRLTPAVEMEVKHVACDVWRRFPAATVRLYRCLGLVVVMGIVFVLARQNAAGLSLIAGYARPTNYELVKQADAIVVARAETFVRKEIRSGIGWGTFRFRILERVKGGYRDEWLTVGGTDDVNDEAGPEDFRTSRPDHGGGNPQDYQAGGNYVLFLEKAKDRWTVSGPPFSRVNVRVADSNAPWVRAVRQYARIAGLNHYEKEKVALKKLRLRALADTADCPSALVGDIDAHFNTATPAKSFDDLRSLYEETTDAKKREAVLWACAHGRKPEAAKFVASLLQSGEWHAYVSPVCGYIAQLKMPGYCRNLAANLATNVVPYERRFLLAALRCSARATEQVLMQTILESIPREEIEVLDKWFVEHPSADALRFFDRLASGDYREEFQSALILAAMGDTNVLAWASAIVRIKRGPVNPERDWLAYWVIASSPHREAGELAREVIGLGDSPGLVNLVQGLSESRRADRFALIRAAAAVEPKSQPLVYWLRRAFLPWAEAGDRTAADQLRRLPVAESETDQ